MGTHQGCEALVDGNLLTRHLRLLHGKHAKFLTALQVDQPMTEKNPGSNFLSRGQLCHESDGCGGCVPHCCGRAWKAEVSATTAEDEKRRLRRAKSMSSLLGKEKNESTNILRHLCRTPWTLSKTESHTERCEQAIVAGPDGRRAQLDTWRAARLHQRYSRPLRFVATVSTTTKRGPSHIPNRGVDKAVASPPLL